MATSRQSRAQQWLISRLETFRGVDTSEEILDLKKAIWAGFIKRRFWSAVGRFDAGVCVGSLIAIATAILLVSLLTQGGWPNQTTQLLFFGLLGA
jgi:hypothetical protein